MRLLIRWLVVTASLIVASWIVPGIRVEDENAWLAVGVTAVVFGFVNAFIRPILAVLSCGLIIATLGLFILVINGFMLWLASYIATEWLGLGFVVEGFWAAFLGALVVSIVSMVLNTMIPDEE
ncbi:MAG: phage holin family protein [Thermoleophilia bacterium]